MSRKSSAVDYRFKSYMFCQKDPSWISAYSRLLNLPVRHPLYLMGPLLASCNDNRT